MKKELYLFIYSFFENFLYSSFFQNFHVEYIVSSRN